LSDIADISFARKNVAEPEAAWARAVVVLEERILLSSSIRVIPIQEKIASFAKVAVEVNSNQVDAHSYVVKGRGLIAPALFMPSGFPRIGISGSLVNTASSRSYGAGVAPHDPGSIGPGLGRFPRTTLLGVSVNRGKRKGRSPEGPQPLSTARR
jgi:hypothetical protein